MWQFLLADFSPLGNVELCSIMRLYIILSMTTAICYYKKVPALILILHHNVYITAVDMTRKS